MSLCEWMVKTGANMDCKGPRLLKAIKDRKLWRHMITHIPKRQGI